MSKTSFFCPENHYLSVLRPQNKEIFTYNASKNVSILVLNLWAIKELDVEGEN